MINPNITVNNFQNMFLSYFYSPLIDTFTRVDEKRKTSSLLDNIYTNINHTTRVMGVGRQQLVAGSEGDQKKLFSLIHSLLGSKKNTVLPEYTSSFTLASTINMFL